ncbi:MAG: hypothetical protein JSS00_09870 [Proteobacteria bacterium]|nr:hypothetical protein [Pseudomonadota bacterium]
MKPRALIAVLALAACSAAYPPYTVLNPNDYHVFVAPWDPADQRFCAAFQSAADWEARMHPAAVMDENRFAPPAEIWRDHAVVMMARETNAGDPAHLFTVTGVTKSTDADALDVHTDFTPAPASTSTIIAYVAVQVPKPLPHVIHFSENGRDVCEIRPRS